jgi:hypothetical protein
MEMSNVRILLEPPKPDSPTFEIDYQIQNAIRPYTIPTSEFAALAASELVKQRSSLTVTSMRLSRSPRSNMRAFAPLSCKA